MSNLITKLVAKTEGQKEYIRSIKTKDITFCIGYAGTGKTAIAIAMGLEGVLKGEYEKLVIIRPQVEARERVGFPPGTADEKYSHYLMAADEELTKWCNAKDLKKLEDQKKIQKIQIAYARGINLHNAFIILEEAQNITFHQFKLLLTRIGEGSKMIVSGDHKQSDLYDDKKYSLATVIGRLKNANIEEIGFVELGLDDIVRSGLVGKIIRALESDI
jgi:phosphate starvation-inducible PhoH-like protein